MIKFSDCKISLWYNDLGQLHREDGPAVVEENGSTKWYLENTRYTFIEWADRLNLDSRTQLEIILENGGG